MSELKSLVGKVYIPCDNSWSVNVTDCGSTLSRAKYSCLAGTQLPYSSAVKCIIVSEPFKCNINTFGISEPNQVREMIMVEYNHETHMVLFYNNCVQ